ncbi:MAG: TolC family protein, partial [Verrucomicrobia bacterium]|nr:TolC family protein [Verrucomicrobiota bacterium]
MFAYLLIILTFFAGPLTSAAVAYDHPLTTLELIDIALTNSPVTKASWWRAHRAGAAVDSKKSAYYPKLDFQADVKSGKEYTFGQGEDHTYSTAHANLSLSWLLFDFGERSSSVAAAKQALIAANWRSDWTMQQVMARVLENCYATQHAEQTLQASLTSLQEAEKLYIAAKDLNQAGLTPITDVYTSQAAFSQMQMEVANKKSNLDIQRGKL